MAANPKIRMLLFILAGCAMACLCAYAQNGTKAPPPIQPGAPSTASLNPADKHGTSGVASEKPLPDVVAMMGDVEANQRKAEAVEKDYIYRSVETAQEVDGRGQAKKTTVTVYDIYWVNGVRVRRMVEKNGKALTPDEIAKENERIDKEAARAHEKREKEDAQGKETNARGDEEVTVSRLLELGAFTNPRRIKLNGRDTIAVDYAGDPKAKTRNRAEEVIRDLVGTAWIDEEDHVLARVEGRFANAYKIGGGLIADIRKDTRFSMEQTKVNGEVWLPARFQGQGAARALLFFSFNGRGTIVNSDYRKFRITSTILPGMTRVDPAQTPAESDATVKESRCVGEGLNGEEGQPQPSLPQILVKAKCPSQTGD